MKKSKGVSILGTGRLGGNYIDIVKNTPGTHLVSIAEPNQDIVQELKKENPDIEFVNDYREAIRNSEIEMVIGTLPHWLHMEAGIAAVREGKHVYMEKPLAVNYKQGKSMLEAAKRNKVKLMTAHTQRYFSVVRFIKELVNSNRLGSILMVHDMWHKPYQPYNRPSWMLDRSKGGGMGQMDGSHQIDRLLWILGNNISSVSAQVGQYTYPKETNPKISCDDTGMYFFRWEDGVVATVTRMAWSKGATEYGADFFFTGGMAKFRIAYGEGPGQETAVYLAEKEAGTWEKQVVEINNPMLDEFRDFVKSLESDDEDTPVPQEHGLNVLKILEATEKSSELGQEIILK